MSVTSTSSKRDRSLSSSLAIAPALQTPHSDTEFPERDVTYMSELASLDSDDFTQALIATAPIALIATDPHGVILAMNPAAEQLTHYRRRDLVGQHSLVLLHDPVELSVHAVKLSHELNVPIAAGVGSLTARPLRGGIEDGQWTYIQKGGKRISVNLRISALRTPEGTCRGYLAMAFDVTERQQLAESMAYMAHHDQLTGLPNRALLDDRLAQAMTRSKRCGRKVAAYMVNIDNFKRFNDSLSNAGGDVVLKYVAEQLRNSVRQTDTVARVGGDEFVVVMPDFGEIEDAERCADLLQRNIAIPTMIGDREIRVTASIGFCLYPDRAVDGTELLRNANIAMRSARASGRGSLVGSSQITKSDISGRLEWEEDLHNALEKGEFSLHYQPQVDCFRGEVTGMEALLRWKSPKRGNVPPSDFIPLAEEIGLMAPISEWVFEKSCRDCVDLQRQTGLSLTLAVNLSPIQFSHRSLASLVERTLAATGLAARNLELEITEQTLMVDSSDTMATLQAVRALGVGIAIDDFGTGFSSFSYILQYKVDRIKIDRSFIAKMLRDTNATAVVKTIIAMAHGLGIAVVAEGVETPEQYEFLLQRRCNFVQGYLLSHPVPKEEFVAAVKRIASMPSVSAALDGGRFRRPTSRRVRKERPGPQSVGGRNGFIDLAALKAN